MMAKLMKTLELHYQIDPVFNKIKYITNGLLKNFSTNNRLIVAALVDFVQGNHESANCLQYY